MRTLETLLAGHAFFRGFAPEHLALLTGCASNVRVDAGRFVFRHGAAADRFYLVRQGLVRVELFSPDRGPVQLLTVGPGEILGWSWLTPPYRWSADARASEPTLALAFDAKCLRAKMEKDHELGYQLMKRFSTVIAKRLEATRVQILDLYAPR